VIDHLSNPRAHGGNPQDAFDLVIPSLPGFGFSGPTHETGWNRFRIAKAWAALMGGLGYTRYGAVGNDIGSVVSPEIGRADPEHVVGVHVTQIYSLPLGDPLEMADLTPEEQTELQTLKWYYENKFSYNQLMSQQPQTLAYALLDSPVGLLAWNSQLLGEEMDADFILDNVMVYWLTATAASAARVYYENAHAPQPAAPTTAPLALAAFAPDFGGIRRLANRDHQKITRWSMFDHGGHYAAHSAPDLLVGDVREFFRGLR
jgi:epoxide hydrolase